jgi:hypothetical protein
MQAEAPRATIAADELGIHLLHGDNDVVVHWGEIAEVHGLRQKYVDGTEFIEVFVDHISGVDFGFLSMEVGYDQTTTEMERYLFGFRRSTLNAVGTLDDEGEDIPIVWKRDESVQPFQLQPPVIDPRGPNSEERARMSTAHQASIATCERILRRPLLTHELACVQTTFENGRIVGSIAAPLCNLLVEHQRGE